MTTMGAPPPKRRRGAHAGGAHRCATADSHRPRRVAGMRFCPRIRSLHRQRIYCADPGRDHGVLKRGRRAVNFRLIAEQWDHIGQFYAAFPAGHATASAALQRLNRFQASNRFYAANRDRPGAEDRIRACSTCPSRNCGRRCGGACSRSSSSTPWRGPSTTGYRHHSCADAR